MAMNPDTNRFEMLTEAEDDRIGREIEGVLREKTSRLPATDPEDPTGMSDCMRGLMENEARGSAAMTRLVRPDGTPVPKHWTVFTQGELVAIKGYTFKVAYIGETSILFEPVGPVIVKPEGEE
jgi:hypothetical protein